MASVRCLDDAFGIAGSLNPNGVTARNLIHGADTVMSHILHFYHLAALDYVDATNPINLGPPWEPTYASGTNVVYAQMTQDIGSGNWVVNDYVEALNIRRKAHTMGAILSGRHPIQNAIVPGGVSTLFTATDIGNFQTLLNEVRNFINTVYVPDVVGVATTNGVAVFGTAFIAQLWTTGTNPGHVLSYGEYPLDTTAFNTNANLLVARGTATYGVPDAALDAPFATSNIVEYVKYSHYKNAVGGLLPATGVTHVDLAKKSAGSSYSWLKAPRYNGFAHEVGPLARMVVSYLTAAPLTSGNPGRPKVSQAGSGVTPWAAIGTEYDVVDLVGTALTAVKANLLAAGINTGNNAANHSNLLFSPLGRHAARMLECKFVADAMGGTSGTVSSWLDQLSVDASGLGSGYVTHTIPTTAFPQTADGIGLCEAPRGALGHWISIGSKTIQNYQCVVPSTWNASPMDDNGVNGPAEQALTGATVGAVDTDVDNIILNILRYIHPYDFCIACAVHVTSPTGKDIAKFAVDTDGKVTKLPLDSD